MMELHLVAEHVNQLSKWFDMVGKIHIFLRKGFEGNRHDLGDGRFNHSKLSLGLAGKLRLFLENLFCDF